MATAEIRKTLADRNKTLREDHLRLKAKKEQITEHLATVLRRAKQMQNLKATLKVDLQRAEADALVHRNKKLAYVNYLTEDLRKYEQDLGVESLKLKNVQAEYQICLKDYDEVLKLVTTEIEAAKVIESEIGRQKQQNANMKAMIFDYERLKRVLEEERKYFKELSNSEEKSHEERLKQLKKILHKLFEEEQNTKGNYQLSKFRFGLVRINVLFKDRMKDYAEVFLRGQLAIGLKTGLGIKIFKNCLDLGTMKHRLSTRKLFRKWHNNIFPKSTLNNLAQNAAIVDIATQKKIAILNKMTETVNAKNMSLFHIYEKSKFLSVLANKISRKDLHYGFSKWRQNYDHKTKTYNKLGKLLFKTVPLYEKRTAFGKWKENANFESRIILANNLLEDYMTTRELSRMFRKWRIQLSNEDIRSVNNYLDKLRMRNKVISRVNYQKRKSKALTTLAFKMTKIKLRNYFTKYWANTKGITVEKLRTDVDKNRVKYSELRKEDKIVQMDVGRKNKRYSLLTFRTFMLNAKLRPYMRKWRNSMLLLRQRSQVILHLALRRQNKNKLSVMNEFRKCVQYFEKKEMHQVLTDLNNKMEAINQKSSNFRERLKKCIEQLGVMASKKIGNVFSYSIMCQQRVYFNKDLRVKVKQLYKEYLLHRFGNIFAAFHVKRGLDEILMCGKDRRKETLLKKAYETFTADKIKRDSQRAFYGWRGVIRSNKTCFRKMTQSENIIMFYRMASAFVAMERKKNAQNVKAKRKIISNNEMILEAKKDNLGNLKSQKQKLEESLQKIFKKFINFEERHIKKQDQEVISVLTKRYFQKYRSNVRDQIYGQKILNHFSGFISQKNNFIFWKGMNALKYENMIDLVKEQLGKVNRKKKALAEKNSKIVSDYDKRLTDAEAEHSEIKAYYDFYLKKFQNTLKFYAQRHDHIERLYYARSVFNTWKRECFGAKRLCLGANQVLQRNLVYPAYQDVVKILRKMKSHAKSQELCVEILLRKAKNCQKDCLILWRCNLKKLKCQKMEADANYMIQNRQGITDECKVKAGLISNENIRVKNRRLLITCFMAMKTDWTEKVYLEKYQIGKMQSMISSRIVRTAMNGLKWLMFYKKTKRAYLKYKKQKFERELKSDVFLSLKIYRNEHYQLINKAQGVYENLLLQTQRYSLDKIINVGAYERDELNYERKKKLRELVMNKVTRVEIIKRKIMAKWHAWLIPRFHYLPNLMKSAELGVLKRSFAKIREHQYWNPIYIKFAADKITNEGYNEVTANTNNLVKQGYDPDEIKDFLEKRNDQDNKTIQSVVNRVKTWGKKQDLVRAWNSWKQYLVLKKKIRRSLAKVFNIAQGIGRYWNRWKSKDPEFNAILEKQSRGNMLERYRDLGRLLKEYKRDVKDSRIYCEELKEINDEYAQKNEEGVRMALSTLSSNLKVGLKQGLEIWRTRVRQHHRAQFDDRYDQLSNGISMLVEQRNKMRYRLAALKEENYQMKEKCTLGAECGQILEKLLKERDVLSIDLADKQHNLKLLLEDNLRLKQKIRAAKANAQKLINRVQDIEP